MKNKLNGVCSARPVLQAPEFFFILTQPELYAKKLSKNYFADLCSKLTFVDVFRNMSRFFNCFQLQVI